MNIILNESYKFYYALYHLLKNFLVQASVKPCSRDIDSWGTTWEAALPGQTSVKRCQGEYNTGNKKVVIFIYFLLYSDFFYIGTGQRK